MSRLTRMLSGLRDRRDRRDRRDPPRLRGRRDPPLAHILLLTYDSCRYDVLRAAETPNLDAHAKIRSAQAPATFTYASHSAFFVCILPNCDDDIEYYNRHTKQLIGLIDVGEKGVAKESLFQVRSERNIVTGLRDLGYQTVGAGAMNWFRQSGLREGFQDFRFTRTDAGAQIDFVLSKLDPSEPFFGFINFGETHAPYTFAGKPDRCPVDVQARRMVWPPVQGDGPVGRDNPAVEHQVRAAAYLDAQLSRLFSSLPGDTVVVLTADHGECFGEDGYWGHAVSHPMVWTVPLAIFRLGGADIGSPSSQG